MSSQARLLATGIRRTLKQPRQVQLALAAAVGVTAITVFGAGLVYNDAAPPKKTTGAVAVQPIQDSTDSLTAWSWGSNDYRVASSSASTTKAIRNPQPLPHLSGIALRDLALHEKHGACVDAAGNVYQWGDEFFENKSKEARKPKLTLTGKDIKSLTITESKVYALSSSGRVFVLSAKESRHGNIKEESSPWWTTSWLWHTQPTLDHVELKPEFPLRGREKFTSISAGRDHLLALTSAGRAFTHAVNAKANDYGQLGISRISARISSNPPQDKPIDLIPKASKDPSEQSTPFARPTAPPLPVAGDDTDIHWSTKLYEVPSLKEVKGKQLIAGGRSSYLLTAEEGRVLSWGANEYGQLGLGATMTLTSVPIPTEVVLSRPYPRGAAVRCTHISTGGDVVYFTMERTIPGENTAGVDVLAAGMGQWGLLGNGQYTQSQGSPVKVRAVSGIMEYNDKTKALEALQPRAISVSPTGHAMLTLDTISDTNAGYDVLTWGQNRSFELGNGKQSAVPMPSYVQPFRTEPGSRFMVKETRKVIKDMEGKVRGRNVPVQETVVAGWGCTAVYWKIV
ncbi:RCC1/BLIP-II [Dacryopinax primogenitus]|uniref:RCC1/BLIP-II n=1 Tax=Dacryopinax primogenitus (strain DJM 731) TaxID=1858805 RepID=M5G9Q3_DACPD|nr:RCC1/BLIP-II [Dacryopinax primogenitus]EJU05539.1 RCC1/BLIP-II [Dacryopinax primogenitus]